jgi:hypothetical protein
MPTCPPFAHRAGGVAVLLLAAACFGAGQATAQTDPAPKPAFDLSGAWVLDVMSPNGAGTRSVTFVQEGDKLTGEIASTMAAGPLTGTVEGVVVRFVAEVFMESGSFTVTYRATWVDGELKEGTVDFGSYGSGTFTGRRKVEGGTD